MFTLGDAFPFGSLTITGDRMCGRFTLRATPQQVAEHFRLFEVPTFTPRYNIGPGQIVGVIRSPQSDSSPPGVAASRPSHAEDTASNHEGNNPLRIHAGQKPKEWAWLKWGLIPHWSADATIANRLINARAETVSGKPAFRSAARYRRCLIPADGFYEWKTTERGKQPYFIRLRGDRLFALAGLWDRWQSPSGEILETCTVLTVEPNPLMAQLHNRMPLILPPEAYEAWIDPAITEFEVLRRWLRPYPEDEMELIAVTPYVNSIRHEGPRCLEPVVAAGDLFENESSQ